WSIISAVSGILVPFLPGSGWSGMVFFAAVKILVPAIVFILAIGAISIGVWRSVFGSLILMGRPIASAGRLAAAFVAGALPGMAVHLADWGLDSLKPQSSVPSSLVLSTLELDLMIYFLFFFACVLIWRWLANAVSAWFEHVIESRSPRLILMFS